jgi:hypothetical protein
MGRINNSSKHAKMLRRVALQQPLAMIVTEVLQLVMRWCNIVNGILLK